MTDRLRTLAQAFKRKVAPVTPAQWQVILRETLQQFELLDERAEWRDEVFRRWASALFPSEFGQAQAESFIDEVASALEENTYLRDFLRALPETPGSVMNFRTREDSAYWSYLLAYAYCLDRSNAAGRADLEFERRLVARYQARRRASDFYRFGNLMVIIKLHSIELPLVRFLRAQARGILPASFAKFILTFNIFEAALADLLLGWWKNARSTFPLMRFPPNSRGSRRWAGGGPAQFSADGKALLLHSPAPRAWADLYQVWNMAFVSQFDIAPFLLAKLMVPSVARYATRPAEYMHTRITALHLALHFLDFAVKDRKLSVDLSGLGPVSKEITQLWGEVNLRCSQDYQEQIRIRVQR